MNVNSESFLEAISLGIFLHYLANNYVFKVNNRTTRKRCEICSSLTIKTPERRQWCRVWVSKCYLWTYFTPFSSFSILDFEQVIVRWVITPKQKGFYHNHRAFFYTAEASWKGTFLTLLSFLLFLCVYYSDETWLQRLQTIYTAGYG